MPHDVKNVLAPAFGDPAYIRNSVTARLMQYLDRQQQRARTLGPDYGQLMGEIRLLMGRGGKRIRPTLAAWSYAGYGGTDEAAIIRAAAAIELFHGGILMHDDIIDRDTTRWGGLNISGRYADQFRGHYGAVRTRHLADSMALMAGDSCITMAYEQLLSSGFKPGLSIAAQQHMHETFFTMLGGELLDLTASLVPLEDIRPQTLTAICEYKTAVYSFSFPLELGALLADTPPTERARLRQLGSLLGVAYQLQDDLLGMFGDEQVTGKPVVSDLREGKRTLLMQLAYQRSKPAGQRVLATWLGAPDVTLQALREVQTVIQDSGAKEQIEALIAGSYAEARKVLRTLGWNQPYAASIEALLAGLLNRQS